MSSKRRPRGKARKRRPSRRATPARETRKKANTKPRRKSPARATPAQRRKPRRRSRWIQRGVKVFSVCVVLAALVWAGLNRFANQPGPVQPAATAVALPAGLSAKDAAELLSQLGLSDSPWILAAYFHMTRAVACFHHGPHLLPRSATPTQIRALLCRTDARRKAKFTVPEGFTRFDIARRLEQHGVASAKSFLAATENRTLLAEYGIDTGGPPEAESAEGYLFPATYDVALNSEASRVVRRLIAESTKRWWRMASAHEKETAHLEKQRGFGRHEIVTLASMIEKEAAVDDERGLIASVFLNRLRDPAFRPKFLQSDPTAAYGCKVMPERIASCRGFAGEVTPAMNRDRHNRYSTYTHQGLPPGPIANPGEASLRAVLTAPATRLFYFVAKGGGRHAFSESYAEHLEAVTRLRALRER
jgi:UPF0755 protein